MQFHTGLTANFPGLWFVKSKERFSVAQFKSDTRSVSQSLCPDRDAGLYGHLRPNEQSSKGRSATSVAPERTSVPRAAVQIVFTTVCIISAVIRRSQSYLEKGQNSIFRGLAILHLCFVFNTSWKSFTALLQK